jgi:hypothetical protein
MASPFPERAFNKELILSGEYIFYNTAAVGFHSLKIKMI